MRAAEGGRAVGADARSRKAPGVRRADAASAEPAVPVAVLRLDELDAVLDDGTALVTVMLANNETGSLQPVAEAAAPTTS